jgi:hypothetical protein
LREERLSHDSSMQCLLATHAGAPGFVLRTWDEAVRTKSPIARFCQHCRIKNPVMQRLDSVARVEDYHYPLAAHTPAVAGSQGRAIAEQRRGIAGHLFNFCADFSLQFFRSNFFLPVNEQNPSEALRWGGGRTTSESPQADLVAPQILSVSQRQTCQGWRVIPLMALPDQRSGRRNQPDTSSSTQPLARCPTGTAPGKLARRYVRSHLVLQCYKAEV